MASIEIKDIRKAYGSVEVLHGVSIDIADGEFVVLVGPSGCGKSTLLRMIAGLESITSGEIRIADTVVNELSPKDRDIAMVFQNYALYPHMTVEQNMSFSMKLRGENDKKVEQEIAKAAEILGLSEYLQRYPRQLSGGQRQRVAMGRAIVRHPRAFLFDEPLSNLDAKLRVQMRTEIKQLQQRLGTTAVYVTHDQIEAMTMASKIVVMQGGIVEQIGDPLDLYDRPANRFVAGFLGSPSMNFLEGRMDGEKIFLTDSIYLPLNRLHSNLNGSGVTCGIRPEHFRICGTGAEMRVEVVEPTGPETLVYGKVGSQKIIGLFQGRIAVKPGEILPVEVSPEQIHLFDGQSGARL